MGWGDLDNGDLLDAMSGLFDALVMVDKRLPEQQHIANRPLAVVVLRAKSNRLADLLPLVAKLLAALASLSAGTTHELSAGGEATGA